MAKRKTYITHPERIYVEPLHPDTSDYDVVIPQTTSDAVLVEGSSLTLTDMLKDMGSVKAETRNTTVIAPDLIRVDGTSLSIGNYVITVADGFTQKGVPVDINIVREDYVNLPTPSSSDIFLLVLKDGTFAYSSYFNGGRDFPTDGLQAGQVFFNEQLRRSYKYNGTSWDEYPCTAIAQFDNGKLDKIFPYNTWWWNEVVWEYTEPDSPAGLQVSVFSDSDGTDYLRVNKGSVIDSGYYFNLDYPIYKKVQLNFSPGNEGGSGDGNYTNIMSNIIPTDISSSNTQGFGISTDMSELYNSLNPSLSTSAPRCQTVGFPHQFTVDFPNSVSINKYTITNYCDGSDIARAIDSWDLLGSTDGVHWDVIDSVSSAGFTTQNEVKHFNTTNTKPYAHIKFIVRKNKGSAYTSFGQIRFFTSVPELNVFVITNGSVTDILTSPYSGPTLPQGYVYYHRIGKISIGETGNLFGDFPNTSISIDTAGKFEYVSSKISEKLDSDLKNINSSAMKEIATLSSPKSDSYSTIINNTVYQAPYSGYITVFNKSANTLIYNSHNQSYVASNNESTLVSGAPTGIPCSVLVKGGTYYKVVSSGATLIRFTPSVGSAL